MIGVVGRRDSSGCQPRHLAFDPIPGIFSVAPISRQQDAGVSHLADLTNNVLRGTRGIVLVGDRFEAHNVQATPGLQPPGQFFDHSVLRVVTGRKAGHGPDQIVGQNCVVEFGGFAVGVIVIAIAIAINSIDAGQALLVVVVGGKPVPNDDLAEVGDSQFVDLLLDVTAHSLVGRHGSEIRHVFCSFLVEFGAQSSDPPQRMQSGPGVEERTKGFVALELFDVTKQVVAGSIDQAFLGYPLHWFGCQGGHASNKVYREESCQSECGREG
mmetsp:Transcript_26951/g.74087  ORF Transcript_26951/g.74087 Transcript_26951/m.74087 type:complete len:269 (+) Transcript_26951:480-1286(+)